MKKILKICFSSMIALGLYSVANSALAEFGTLFTTASERKIIDDNRYVIKKIKTVKQITTVAKIEVEQPKEIIYKIIKKEYKISGISIANNGLDTAWINSKLYEHGAKLDEKTQIKINASKRKIRFIVRGGKTFKGQSGDVVTVSYRVPLLD